MSDRKQELSKKLIIEALKKFRGLCKSPPSDEDLETYGDMLVGEYEFKQITWALTQHVKKGSVFFPSCGELFGYLTPREESVQDRAPVVVNEIIQAIRLHPYDLESRMYPTLSPEAAAVIHANGGTRSIRDSDNFETMKAQIERLAKGVLASIDSAKKNAQLAKIGITGNVIEMKRPEMRSLDFSTFTTNEPA